MHSASYLLQIVGHVVESQYGLSKLSLDARLTLNDSTDLNSVFTSSAVTITIN